MKIPALLVIFSAAAVSLLPVALAAPQKQQAEASSDWLVALSNLPREERARYLAEFASAKESFRAGRWVICFTTLQGCEMIFNKNPHVWSLMAGCLIEQQQFDEAEVYVEKVEKVLPGDSVNAVNRSRVYMGRGEYARCIETVDKLISTLPGVYDGEVINVLTYRQVLCHLLLGQRDEAVARVSHLSAMDDTPLFYYSRVAIALFDGDLRGARRDLSAVRQVFANNKAYVSYERALTQPGLVDALPKANPGLKH